MKTFNLAIIGGGPGGIGSAVEASAFGIKKVVLIEKGDNHSQTIRKFYKENKRVDKDWRGQKTDLLGNIGFGDGTRESTIDYFDSLLDNHKIEAVFNAEVESILKQDNGYFLIKTQKEEIAAKYVIIAIGKMGKPNRPPYELPISLKDRINFNIDKCSANEKILVVGGGDSAAEYAYELAEKNIVTLCYRQKVFTRLNPRNEHIVNQFNGQEKLRLRLGVDIMSIENEHGMVKINFNDTFSVVYDRIIYAIGGTTPIDFLKKSGIELNEKGEPRFDENHESSAKGLFIAGDIAFDSGGSIAMALNHGYKIANFISLQDHGILN